MSVNPTLRLRAIEGPLLNVGAESNCVIPLGNPGRDGRPIESDERGRAIDADATQFHANGMTAPPVGHWQPPVPDGPCTHARAGDVVDANAVLLEHAQRAKMRVAARAFHAASACEASW